MFIGQRTKWEGLRWNCVPGAGGRTRVLADEGPLIRHGAHLCRSEGERGRETEPI